MLHRILTDLKPVQDSGTDVTFWHAFLSRGKISVLLYTFLLGARASIHDPGIKCLQPLLRVVSLEEGEPMLIFWGKHGWVNGQTVPLILIHLILGKW